MKSSLISKKNLIPNKNYWCSYSMQSELSLMTYKGHGLFQYKESTLDIDDIKVMFKGYKTTVPSSSLIIGRLYWCNYNSDDVLELMRYEGEGSIYLVGKDHIKPLNEVDVIFEDYENK